MKTLPLTSFILLLACLALPQAVHGQYLQSSSTMSPYTSTWDLEYRTDGTFFAKSPYATTGTLPSLGTGPRFLWFPKIGVIRAGYFNGTDWDESLYGADSTAFGYKTTAQGNYSLAIGNTTLASGTASVALGLLSQATAAYSTALGNSTHATALYSTALGYGTYATQTSASAFGSITHANGQYSASFGYDTKADAVYSTALGRWNVGGGSNTTWNSNEALLEVGNGTDNTNRSNALTLDKSGNLTVGTVTVTTSPVAGDIPMFGH